MKYKKLNNIMLHTIAKGSDEEINFYKELIKDDTINYRVHGLSGLTLSTNKYPFLGRAFLTSLNDHLFGYIHIGNYNKEEKAVYLKVAIHKNNRGLGYGKLLLEEITDYIFLNYEEIESIKLKIERDNLASINTANACGYKWLIDDFYVIYNPNLNEDVKRI